MLYQYAIQNLLDLTNNIQRVQKELSLSLSAENVRMTDGLYRLSYEGVPHPGNTVLKVEGGLMTFRDSPTGPLREVTLEYGQVN